MTRPPQIRAYLGDELVVDLFAGGGGASTGIERAIGRSPDIAINHSPVAISKQCKTCPWRVGVDPDRDIPGGYSRELHAGLRGTIADGAHLSSGPIRVMACHYSPVGAERACAGWLHNQLGPGNSLAVRLAVFAGKMPGPEVDGPQHDTFEATLPRTRKRRRAIRG